MNFVECEKCSVGCFIIELENVRELETFEIGGVFYIENRSFLWVILSNKQLAHVDHDMDGDWDKCGACFC